jgi:acetyl-CoA C-acetyltransferase
MNLDPRTPVLVGVAQLEQRAEDLAESREPLDLMFDAAAAAAEDAGSRELLGRADSVRVIRGAWRYQDPGRAIAEHIGAPGAETALTPFGGNMVQVVLNDSCAAIQKGDRDVILIAGAECGNSRGRARKAGVRLGWREAPGEPDAIIGKDSPMAHDAELAREIRAPVQVYAMFENAIRAARGESIPEHLKRVSELWARFNAVAVQNPHAWIREPISAEEIRTPGPRNRPVSFPYTKLMNANSAVDQAGALLLCSVETARRLGVPPERWVFPWAGTEAHDHLFVSERDDLHSSPAIRIAGRRLLDLSGLDSGDLAHVDLYSCFPSAVQVAAAELGLPLERPLTVTGGLTFGGGPLNCYVLFSVARMAELLRQDPGARGLVTANGGYLTKHALVVYSTEPPSQPFRREDVQPEVDATPRREALVDWEGEVEIESYVVMYGAEGPEVANVAGLTPDGRRTWANSGDRDLLHAMTRDEFCGRSARIDGAGGLLV